MQGAKRTIEEYSPILYVECDRESKAKDLQNYIASLNYEMYWHASFLADLKNNYYDCHENCFEKMYKSFNLLCIPKGIEKPQSREIEVSDLHSLNSDQGSLTCASIGKSVQKIIV